MLRSQAIAKTSNLAKWKASAIAVIAALGIGLHLVFRVASSTTALYAAWPLWLTLTVGGLPLLAELANKAWERDFGADWLAGISIISGVLLGEYLAASIVVLMLSGGEALEAFAVRQASRVLEALAKRMPERVHRRTDGHVEDVAPGDVEVGDLVVVYPHETCPVDGIVADGHGTMDESYLTGEPYAMSKAPGTAVLSGAINGESVLTIRVERRAVDSRYAQIMRVMRESEQRRPQLRRLGDMLGGWYTPLALLVAGLAWWASGEASRFLAVLVVATPCPLLIAIPVVILGSVSSAAARGIIVKNPAALEQLSLCRTMIFDKTGTLTYGEPRLTEIIAAPGFADEEALRLTACLERYSKHPLARAVEKAAAERKLTIAEAGDVSEPPGQGMTGTVGVRRVRVTSRKMLAAEASPLVTELPPASPGMECVVVVDGRLAATMRFRDEPRRDGARFIRHLGPRHQIRKLMLVSGDRESEVRYLADKVGIGEVHAGRSPEEKVEIVRRESAAAPTLFLGDGINDAPALAAATIGAAFGQANDVTSEAADVVVMDTSLEKVDELLHIGLRMRIIALQSALAGMGLSVVGMGLAATGYLPPVAGAVFQEVIDVIAVLNALRAAYPPRELTDI